MLDPSSVDRSKDPGPSPYCPTCGAPATRVAPVGNVLACSVCRSALLPVRLAGGGVAPFLELLSPLDPRAAAVRDAVAGIGAPVARRR